MERHHTGSTGKTQPAGNARRVASSLAEKRSLAAADKLTRKQVSDCINIWATVYHLRDPDTDAAELCLPPSPWTSQRGGRRFGR